MRSDRPTRVLPVECSALRTPHGLATCPFLRQARGKFVWNKQLSYVAISLTIAGRYVLDIFMSAATAIAALPNRPEPAQERAAGAAGTPVPEDRPAQARPSRVLGLLRKLIVHGQDLARTVQGRAAAATLFTVAVHFGTSDMALILARITRGLRLAAALEARLVRRPVR